MRYVVAALALVTLSVGQWIETTIPLPDSMPGLRGIDDMQYHAANQTMYVSGNDGLFAVDAATRRKLARLTLPGSVDVMCSSPASNKLYCAGQGRRSLWVTDCATNGFSTTVSVDSGCRDMCYATAVNKVYVACSQANSVNVIDCETDSVVARVGSLAAVSALCYNPRLNRIYSALSGADKVAVIDCATDEVIRTIWVRGVEPADICFDSVANCVLTANQTSNTISVIDCAGDSLVRVVIVGAGLGELLVGPGGKVYCAIADSVLVVIDGGETRAIPLGGSQYASDLSYDPVNGKVYVAGSDSESNVVVVDAVGDSVVARVGPGKAGRGPYSLCYDPGGSATWSATRDGATVGVIDGRTDEVTGVLPLGVFCPGTLRYNHLNNRLYCLAAGNAGGSDFYLTVIDGDSNRVLRVLPAGYPVDSMIWNPASNKVYFTNSGENTVTVVDCTSDSIAATIGTGGDWPRALCCSDDGKVYVANEGGGVTVIDPNGDTVRTVIPVGDSPYSICYNRTDRKVYVGKRSSDDPVTVIDVDTDSIVATVAVGLSRQSLVWNQNHAKVYAYCSGDDSVVAVIDCTGDTVLRSMVVSSGLGPAYSDASSDRVYFVDHYSGKLRIIDPRTDTFYRSLAVREGGALVDNGLRELANRLYCIDYSGVIVVAAYKLDSILRRIEVGDAPCALAWNPAHSRVYVSSCSSSSIMVLRDTLAAGVEEERRRASRFGLQAAVVRGVLNVAAGSREHSGFRAELLDVSGRRVMDLHLGANDVRALAPGVYFVREAQAQAQAQALRKVITTR